MSKIDCSRPIEELNEGTQAEIEKIRWDEQQKLKGKHFMRTLLQF